MYANATEYKVVLSLFVSAPVEVIDLTRSPSLNEVGVDDTTTIAHTMDDVNHVGENLYVFPKIMEENRLPIIDYAVPVPNFSTLPPVSSTLFQQTSPFASA